MSPNSFSSEYSDSDGALFGPITNPNSSSVEYYDSDGELVGVATNPNFRPVEYESSSDEDDDEYERGLIGVTMVGIHKYGGYFPGEPGHPPVMHLDYFREDQEVHDYAKSYAREALKSFTDDSGKQYELVDILIFHWSCALDYYVTFSAKQKDDANVVKTIRAIVEDEGGEITVTDCIIKPDDLNNQLVEC